MRFSLKLLVLGLLFSSCNLSCNQTDKKQDKIEKADTITIDLGTETDTISIDSFEVFIDVAFNKAKGIPINDRLRDMIEEEIDSVETIDFTGDNILDFLVKRAGDKNSIGFEYWVSSDYKIIKKVKYYLDSFHYRGFINLDDDPEPEICDAVGEEDSPDYTVQDKNLVTRKDSILLYANLVIIEKAI